VLLRVELASLLYVGIMREINTSDQHKRVVQGAAGTVRIVMSRPRIARHPIGMVAFAFVSSLEEADIVEMADSVKLRHVELIPLWKFWV